MTFRHAALWSTLGASLLAIGCSGGAGGPAGPSASVGADGKASLQQHSHVLSQTAIDAANVQADRVVFSGASVSEELAAHQPGDVLIGDRSDTNGQNPLGFLRKVVSLTTDGSTTTVMTAPATLLDAVESLQFQANLDTPALDTSGPVAQSEDALRMQDLRGSGKTLKLIDFSGTKLLDETGSLQVDSTHNVGYQIFATVTKGTIGLTPSWDIGADIGFFKINSFHATATGDLAAEIEVDAGVKLTSTIDSATFTKLVAQTIFKSKSATLADYDTQLGKVQVGPFSIPINIHFNTTLACDFHMANDAEVVIGGKADETVTAGVSYDKHGFSPIFKHTDTLTQTGPNWTLNGLTKIKCSITPTFTIKFWDIASGQFSAYGYVDVGGSLSCPGKDANGDQQGEVQGGGAIGANATVKADVDILGLIKWSKSCTLFDANTSKTFDEKFVLPGGTNATCTGSDTFKLDPAPTVSPDVCFSSCGGG